MECPNCGYMMDAFAVDCPRCAHLRRQGRAHAHTRQAIDDERYRQQLLARAYVPEAAAPPTMHRLASTALILSLLGPLTAFPGIVLGIVALHQINHSRGRLAGAGQAVAGIIISWVSLSVTLALAIWLMPYLQVASRQAQGVVGTVQQLVQTINQAQTQLEPLTGTPNSAPVPTANPSIPTMPPHASSPSAPAPASPTLSEEGLKRLLPPDGRTVLEESW